jgi:hypothetical protein
MEGKFEPVHNGNLKATPTTMIATTGETQTRKAFVYIYIYIYIYIGPRHIINRASRTRQTK